MFAFEFTTSPTEVPSGFALGHFRVDVDGNRVTSEGRSPDQAFMVFVMATSLLDQVAALLTSRQRAATVVCTDSALELELRRVGKGRIEVGLGGRWLGAVEPEVLAETVFDAVVRLRDDAGLGLGDAASQDLDTAITEFRPLVAAP
ncbi:MAG: hypothetical protein AAF799_28225 [Myxococcota bacterium]